MPNRLKSCKNAGAAQTRTRDVFPWRTSVHFLFYIVWRWIIKIKSMLILSQGFAKACKLFCPTKRFSKNLCAESVPAVCACDLDGAENWHLHHLQTEQGGRQLTGKNKGTEHVTCNHEDPWIHSCNVNYFISASAKLWQSEIYVNIQDSVRIILSNHH